MKFVQAFVGTAYRMHTPSWAHSPTSGTGAGTHGGRVNRVGVNALYLSKESQTAGINTVAMVISRSMPPSLP